MKTLKNGLKQENIDSIEIKKIIIDYSRKDKVRVALYCTEDCFHLNPNEESQLCIDLVKKWLNDETSVTVEELRIAADAADAAAIAADAADAAANAADAADAAAYAAYAAAYAADAAADAAAYAAYAAYAAVAYAVRSFGENREFKLEEYRNYARLFAYEDLDFQYKDFSKTFNLDNPTDLNIFLDFLTDNYPEALIYSREEFMKERLSKEYLKVIYQ